MSESDLPMKCHYPFLNFFSSPRSYVFGIPDINRPLTDSLTDSLSFPRAHRSKEHKIG